MIKGFTIKDLLKTKKKTSKELANAVGLSEKALSWVLNKKQKVDYELLYNIAEFLDVDIKDLFESTKDAITIIDEKQGLEITIKGLKTEL